MPSRSLSGLIGRQFERLEGTNAFGPLICVVQCCALDLAHISPGERAEEKEVVRTV